jgi:hypothetical protein
MITSQIALKRYGKPDAANKCMVLWDVPTELEIGMIPKRIYCNKDLVIPLGNAFKNLMIDVVSIESNGAVKGNFPIKGTTWIISNN